MDMAPIFELDNILWPQQEAIDLESYSRSPTRFQD